MDPIVYIDRATGRREVEKVYGGGAIGFLYGNTLASRILGKPLVHILSRLPLFSALAGWWKRRPWTARSISRFVEDYGIDQSEFLEGIDSYRSFDDFFTRKLKPEARPVALGKDIAVIPADGRHLFYQRIDKAEGFVVKGQKFNLSTLLEDAKLAEEYSRGTMIISRLCPTDYHRFHFPCACIPGNSKFINGWLYSVNPAAVRKDINIFTQNKRTLCKLDTECFGRVLYMEIGATSVGSIHQTYTPFLTQLKGAEKGYFSFGASSLILLFPPDSIILDEDLLEATRQGMEIKCLMGQTMGKAAGLALV